MELYCDRPRFIELGDGLRVKLTFQTSNLQSGIDLVRFLGDFMSNSSEHS
jgi:hypothetical protein